MGSSELIGRRVVLVFAAVLTVSATAACRRHSSTEQNTTTNVTPWFRIERKQPAIEAPHALEVSGGKVSALVQVGGEWKNVATDSARVSFSATALQDDRAVLLHRQSGYTLYQRGSEVGAPLPCKGWVAIPPDGSRVFCLAADRPHGEKLQLAEITIEGRIERSESIALPGQEKCDWDSEAVGFSPDGFPVEQFACNHQCSLLELRWAGAKELPVGSSDCERVRQWKETLPQLSLRAARQPVR